MKDENIQYLVSELVRLTVLHEGLQTANSEHANMTKREIYKLRDAIVSNPIDVWLAPVEKLADHPSLAVRITASILVHKHCDRVLNRKRARERLEELAKEDGIAAMTAMYYLSEHAKS